MELDDDLKEISGLHYESDSALYAIQDEKGIIFRINPQKKVQSRYISFKKSGDFEGITYFKNCFYVLESDGDIFKVDKQGEYQKFDFLSNDKDFEFEGLTAIEEEEILLIACKKHGKKEKNNLLYIYQYSIDKEKYLEEPFLVVDKKKFHKKFKASGISINGQGNLILVSAATFTMVELNRDGEVINNAQFPFLLYPQLEGVCFSPTGDLYLASEKGDQDVGKIVKLTKNE